MAGTDNSRCAVCGENFYDRPDRVGDVCPECWHLQQLEAEVADTQRVAEEARQRLDERRQERRDQQKAQTAPKKTVKA